MEDENNEYPILKKDRDLARALDKILGVDAHKYTTEQLNKFALSYAKACGVGAIAGATVGTSAAVATTLGLGTPLTAPVGALVGCGVGIGIRALSIGPDTIGLLLDKFQRSL